jgi:protein tyrosine/serine phosphatase
MMVLLAGLVAMAAGAVMVWPAIHDVATGQGLPDTTPVAVRPAAWALPLSTPGVENFYRINDQLYRGAQPTEVGMRNLHAMGIKTIVNLRADYDDADVVRDTDLVRVNIPTESWDLKPQQVAEFLEVVTDPARQPVFFHCRQGADRAGAMAAAYRIVVEGWSKEAAIEEMTRGGYGFHRAWAGLVDVVRDLDVQDLRRQLNLPAPAAHRPMDVPRATPR